MQLSIFTSTFMLMNFKIACRNEVVHLYSLPLNTSAHLVSIRVQQLYAIFLGGGNFTYNEIHKSKVHHLMSYEACLLLIYTSIQYTLRKIYTEHFFF